MAVTIATHAEQISRALSEIYADATAKWLGESNGSAPRWNINQQTIQIVDRFWAEVTGSNSTTIVTNLTTCLIAKVVDSATDVRYHRQPESAMPPPPSGGENYFAGRVLSENLVAPWLRGNRFFTAHSGWQTRTFERPRPYTLDYPENIGHAKSEFLQILDLVQARGTSEAARDLLTYLFYKQIQYRESQAFELTVPGIRDIDAILSMLDRHINYHYSQKGASRLPVLALHAVYSCMMPEISRYKDKVLRPLQRHEAADARTGTMGDIEVRNIDETPFEGLEVKHGITVDLSAIQSAYEKFHGTPSVSRYYILTTAVQCGGDDRESLDLLSQIRRSHGCEVIVNGVLPTIRYYLRLLSNPACIFAAYTRLLATDESLGYEHRKKWNEIAIGR